MVADLPTVQRRYVEIESVHLAEVAAADRRRDAAQAALLRELLADQVASVVTPPAKPPGSRRRGPERAETTPTSPLPELPPVAAQPSGHVSVEATGLEQESQDDSADMF